MPRPTRWVFHRLTIRDYDPSTPERVHPPAWYVESTRRFVERFQGRLELAGRSVLDVGCGSGYLCAKALEDGARLAVGVDIGSLRQLPAPLAANPSLAERFEFFQTDGSLDELGGRQFDLVLSKDSFEHYANPEAFVSHISEHIAPGGELAIGFGPLWKSPFGGHIDFMTRLPWAHLLFPEDVIMAERRRFRPEEDARRFEEIKGGLNKMTLRRFRQVMEATGFECRYFTTNVSDNPGVKAMRVGSRLPGLREYLTANVYSIWAKSN